MIRISLITVTYKLFQFSITIQQEKHTKRYGLWCENEGRDGMYICLSMRTQKQAKLFVQVFHTQVPRGRR